jgi:ABC-type branched-subunit amino acid transport system substrate-binding protein
MDSRSFPRRTRSRIVMSIAAAAVVLLPLAACSSGGGGGDSTADGKGGTITLGMVASFNQPGAAENATDVYQGVELGMQYLEENGGLYNGAKFKIRQMPDNVSDTSIGTSSLRTLFNDGIKLIIGPDTSANCQAASQLIDQNGAVSLHQCTTTLFSTAERPGKNLFNWDTNDQLTSTALAAELKKDYSDVDTIDIVAYDYLQGHTGVETFKKALSSAGLKPKIGKEFFVPTSETNYSAQINALAQEPASSHRVLVLLTYGAGYLNFIQQATPLNLFDNYEAVLTTSMYYRTAVALQGKAPKIWNSYSTCYATLWDTKAGKWLVDATKKKYKVLPDDWKVFGFNSVQAYAAAINKAKSSDPAKVLAAMQDVKVDLVQGEATMDPKTHQAKRPVPVCQTEGDPSGQDGVKLLASSIFDSSDLLKLSSK